MNNFWNSHIHPSKQLLVPWWETLRPPLLWDHFPRPYHTNHCWYLVWVTLPVLLMSCLSRCSSLSTWPALILHCTNSAASRFLPTHNKTGAPSKCQSKVLEQSKLCHSMLHTSQRPCTLLLLGWFMKSSTHFHNHYKGQAFFLYITPLHFGDAAYCATRGVRATRRTAAQLCAYLCCTCAYLCCTCAYLCCSSSALSSEYFCPDLYCAL